MPVLSGFMPIPLAMMIPFMGAQSLVLGKQFGEGFQYGKRKISAMSNEEFNAITPAKLAQNNAEELKQMIPSMQQSITDMRGFQSFIVKELIETIKQLPADVFSGIVGGDIGSPSGASPSIEAQLFKIAAQAISSISKNGIQLNLGGLGNFLPQAFAEGGDQSGKKRPPDFGPSPELDLTIPEPNWKTLTLSEAQKIRNKIKDLGQTITQKVLYQNILLFIKIKIQAVKDAPPPPQQKEIPILARNEKIIQDALVKYFNIWKNAKDLIFELKTNALAVYIRLTGINLVNDSKGRKTAFAWARIKISAFTKKQETAKQIFNLKLKLAQNYPGLRARWSITGLIR